MNLIEKFKAKQADEKGVKPDQLDPKAVKEVKGGPKEPPAMKAPSKKTKIVDPPVVKNKINFEPEITNEQLSFIFEDDLTDINQHTEIMEQVLVEIRDLDEDLSAGDRLKRAMTFRRARVKIKRSRQLAMRRRATSDTIKSRSRRSAIDTLKRKFAGGRSLADLGVSERNRIERMAHARQGTIKRLSRKLIPKKREEDSARLSRK